MTFGRESTHSIFFRGGVTPSFLFDSFREQTTPCRVQDLFLLVSHDFHVGLQEHCTRKLPLNALGLDPGTVPLIGGPLDASLVDA